MTIHPKTFHMPVLALSRHALAAEIAVLDAMLDTARDLMIAADDGMCGNLHIDIDAVTARRAMLIEEFDERGRLDICV
jgi:hypothetical protein